MAEFQELRIRNDLDESQSQEVMRFITGLKKPLRSQVDVRNVQSFPEVEPPNMNLN